jgi:hypothetical protein
MTRNILCFFGSHKQGPWERDDSSFCKVRKCLRCQCLIERKDHQWSDWTEKEQCGVVRKCKTCGKTERRNEHQWSGWLRDNQPCTESRKCLKCGKEESRKDHLFGDWQNRGDTCACVCRKCGEEHETSHDWEFSSSGGSSGTQNVIWEMNTCRQCGAVEMLRDEEDGYSKI